ncbi:MAG: amidohydrolase [Beijerinckiaceae bacterium]|nr:amidohydrolase [Beijerinckiaceae bacterium]
MIIDAQVHLWPPETPSRPWPSDGARRAHLKEPMSYPDMLKTMDRAGVDRVIIVPPSWEGDRNDYALEAARRHPDRFAVMGRIALDDPASADLVKRWFDDAGMLGARINFSDDKTRWLEDGTADWFWPAAQAAAIPVMMHAPGCQAKFSDIASACPQLRIIVDHMNISTRMAKDQIPAAIEATAALARHPNVAVKLSSVPAYSTSPFPYADMDRHLETLVSAFGAERCFWGSDLSHGKGKIDYENYVTHFTDHLPFLDSPQRRLILGEAIAGFLGWPR